MTEQLTTIPNPGEEGRVHNTAQALDMAHAEKPYRELESHARELGLGHVVTEMATHAGNAGYWAQHESAQQPGDTQSQGGLTEHDSQVTAPEDSAERAIAPERLSQILKDSGVGVHSWLTGQEVPKAKRDLAGGGFMRLGTSREVREATKGVLDKNASYLGQFEEHNVSEVITVEEMPGAMKYVKPETAKPEEPIVVVSYATTNRHSPLRSKYKQPRATGHADNFMGVCLFMPQSDAAELIAAVRDDPGVIREAVDMAMGQEIEASTSWEQIKPPYDEWREANSGVNRIALCEGSQSPAQAQILEF